MRSFLILVRSETISDRLSIRTKAQASISGEIGEG